MKSFVILVLMLFCTISVMTANECVKTEQAPVASGLSVVSKSFTGSGFKGFEHFGMSRFSGKRAGGGFLAMGITGAVLTGLGGVYALTGALLFVTASLYGPSASYSVYGIFGGSSGWSQSDIQLLAFIFLGLSGLFIFVGLPLMIVGFIVRKVMKNKKVSFFTRSDMHQNAALGLSIKL